MEASPHGGFTAPDHLLCINGLDKRQEIAIQLESYIELDVSGFRLRAEDVSTILMAPIEHFKSGQVFSVHRFQHNGVRYYLPLACYMKRHLEGIAPLCKHCYCAFKHICTECCDENKSKVTLQFRWMPQIKKCLGQEIDVHGTGPGSDWQQWIEELNVFHNQDNPLPAPYQEALRHLNVSGDPLLSGQLIHIHMPTDDTKRFGKVIDIQWACILFIALVGATGNPELLSMNPGDKVMQWIQSQAREAFA
ncbi:hypothetical protein FCOIX_3066 [Fusarium coicis]|nr:hypothetical protein FCOIX_3066 [Fusarium coicis]